MVLTSTREIDLSALQNTRSALSTLSLTTSLPDALSARYAKGPQVLDPTC